jgi:5-methylcytosine-specific restriction protein A
MSIPAAEDFKLALEELLNEATKKKVGVVNIRSGDLHTLVGGYPGSNHRMPVCCEVMRQEMNAGDTILRQPPKGNGANLVIRYRLPR